MTTFAGAHRAISYNESQRGKNTKGEQLSVVNGTQIETRQKQASKNVSTALARGGGITCNQTKTISPIVH